MTKTKLIQRLSERANIPRQTAEHVVNTIFDAMRQALKEGRRIEIRGFGTFKVRHYAAFQGRNPRTRAIIHVGSKVLPVFRAGKEIRERLNQGRH